MIDAETEERLKLGFRQHFGVAPLTLEQSRAALKMQWRNDLLEWKMKLVEAKRKVDQLEHILKDFDKENPK